MERFAVLYRFNTAVNNEASQTNRKMTTVTLNVEQRRRAKAILQRLSGKNLTEPRDIIGQWKQQPDYNKLNTDKPVFEMDFQKKRKYVPVSDIIGTGAGSVDRLEQDRLKKVIELLIENKFEKEHERPPKLEQVGSDYYVAVDGVHRTLAFKFIGIEKIYADVIEIPVN